LKHGTTDGATTQTHTAPASTLPHRGKGFHEKIMYNAGLEILSLSMTTNPVAQQDFLLLSCLFQEKSFM